MPKTRFIPRDLKRERESIGLSQAQAARVFTVNKRTYQRWEARGAIPQMADIIWKRKLGGR